MSEDLIAFTDIHVNDAIVDRAHEVLESKRYVKGPVLQGFEHEFADFCETDHAVGVSSGTAALLLSLRATGIEAGDDVFVPANTFFATVSPVLALDANPVFVDVDPVYYMMDPEDLRRKAADATNPQAVVPVHLYGHPTEMGSIGAIAAEHDLAIVEDACQAHGATHDGERVGGLGDVGCFSFYPSKNMTVGGDGGMIVTDDSDVARRAQRLRNHGRDEEGTHVAVGLNYRLDELNAAIGTEQLSHLDAWNEQRREAARRYTQQLSNVEPVVTPTERNGATHVYHLYVIQVPDRNALRDHLADREIETGVHYPTPAHRHPAVIEQIGDVGGVERAEDLCSRILSLPMHPRLTVTETDRVCTAIEEYYA